MSSRASHASLHDVTIVDLSRNPDFGSHKKALTIAGATVVQGDIDKLSNIGALIGNTCIKVAILLDAQGVTEDQLRGISGCIDQLAALNPTHSFRVFGLDEGPESDVKMLGEGISERFRHIFPHELSPRDFPRRILRSLHKSRLPLWLRAGYEVVIADTTEEIGDTHYRPITLQKFLPSERDRAVDYSGYDVIKIQKTYYIVRDDGELEISDTVPNTDARVLILEKNKNLFIPDSSTFYYVNGDDIAPTKPSMTRNSSLDYESLGLYVHDKCLYQKMESGDMVQVDGTKGQICVKKPKKSEDRGGKPDHTWTGMYTVDFFFNGDEEE